MSIITSVDLTAEQISGNENGECVLLSVSPLEEYVDGKPSGKVVGQKYHIVCPNNKYEKFIVKIKGKPTITNDQIQQAGGQVRVIFDNLTGKFYRTNSGEYALSCNADSAEVIK